MKRIILQLFQWKLSDIISHLKEIEGAGYNFIQISPIQPTKDNGYEWWKLYQPLDFSIGNSQIGTREDLIELCEKAKKCGLGIICDVVVSHMATKNDNPLEPNEKVNKTLLVRNDFWKEKKLISNWENRKEVITLSNGMPCLDLKNHDLQDIIINFLNELVDCGVSGFRFDSAKSIALPSEGSDFWVRVPNSIKNKDIFMYAEVIFSNKELIDEYNKYIDVATTSPSSDNSKIVSYVENHDTFLEFGFTKDMNIYDISNEWRKLSNIYNNLLFYARPFSDDWKNDCIKNINLANSLELAV